MDTRKKAVKDARAGVDRREFIRYGACGLGALALGGCGFGGGGSGEAPAPGGRNTPTAFMVDLTITDALVEMVTLETVYHWVFADAAGPKFPGPPIFAITGDTITFNVTNALDEVHEFRIIGAGPGGAHVDSGPIAPAEKATFTFTPTVAGTFLYLDPRNAPVNRALGLTGPLVVLPAGVKERTAVNTPYVAPTTMVQQLFNDFGSDPEFPGDPWVPIRPPDKAANLNFPAETEPFFHKTRIWIMQETDPVWNARVEAGQNAEPGGGIDPLFFYQTFKPEYFMLSGRSSQFAMHSTDTLVEGFIGEPKLLRVLNAGLHAVSIHLHANHFYVLSVNNRVLANVPFIDTMTVGSVEADGADPAVVGAIGDEGGNILYAGSRVDWIVPFIRPPDIPGDKNLPLRELLKNEFALVLGGVPQSPLKYPIHDHMEPSNTAIGGNYPNGFLSDFVILGDVDKVFFPKPV